MRSPSPARWIAPAALAAALLTVFLIIAGSTGDDGSDSASQSGTTTERREAPPRRRRTGTTSERTSTTTGTTSTLPTSGAKAYTVRPGDTMQIISQRTGVPVDRLLELNPDADPQSLTVGQRIKLAE